MPKHGHQLRCAYGRETTWGTAVTPDRSFRIVRWSMKRDVPKVKRPYLLHSTASTNVRKHFRTADNAGGQVEYEFNLEGMGPLLADAFGAAPTTSGAGPYVHTFKLGLGQTVGATLQGTWYDDDAAADRGEIFEGCVASRTELSWRIGETGRMVVDYIAETSGGITSTLTAVGSSPYTANDLPAIFNQAGNIVWNSATVAVVRSVKITIDHKIERRPKIGALTTAKPLKSDHADILVELECEWEGTTFDAGLTADTEASFTVTFTNGSASVAITAHNAYVDSCDQPISGAGIVSQTVRLRAQSDGTNEGIQFALTNSQSAYDAV